MWVLSTCRRQALVTGVCALLINYCAAVCSEGERERERERDGCVCGPAFLFYKCMCRLTFCVHSQYTWCYVWCSYKYLFLKCFNLFSKKAVAAVCVCVLKCASMTAWECVSISLHLLVCVSRWVYIFADVTSVWVFVCVCVCEEAGHVLFTRQMSVMNW